MNACGAVRLLNVTDASELYTNHLGLLQKKTDMQHCISRRGLSCTKKIRSIKQSSSFGLSKHAKKMQNSMQCVDGDLVFAPAEEVCVEPALATPLFACLSPLPRYVTEPRVPLTGVTRALPFCQP
jgi:hypothetical protein